MCGVCWRQAAAGEPQWCGVSGAHGQLGEERMIAAFERQHQDGRDIDDDDLHSDCEDGVSSSCNDYVPGEYKPVLGLSTDRYVK